MPKINQIRIINAYFNEAKRVFQDFRMPFYGANTTYELINGGGKSVLLMLVLQCVLPNSYLDSRKRLKEIFRGSEQGRTTHVLVEWELEEGLYEHKYLLTGFCAKKKSNPEDMDKSGTPEHFNYIHLYDRKNDFDINRIPLCEDSDGVFTVLDISKTREKLRSNGIWLTDNHGAYSEMITQYNIIPAEMELIRRINKDENYLKNHFIENYGTSRTLVQKLLLHTTTECLNSRKNLSCDESVESVSESLASALSKSQNDLKRLNKEIEQLDEYNQLYTEVQKIRAANIDLLESFSKYEDIKKQASSQLLAYSSRIKEKEEEYSKATSNHESAKRKHSSIELDIENLDLMKLNASVNISKKDLEGLETERQIIEQHIDEIDHSIRFAEATNKYLKIQNYEIQIKRDKNTLEDKTKGNEELLDKQKHLGQKLHSYIKQEYDRTEQQLSIKQKEFDNTQTQFDAQQRDIGSIENEQRSKATEQSDLEKTIDELGKTESKLRPRLSSQTFISGRLLKDKIKESVDAIQKLWGDEQRLSAEISEMKVNRTEEEGNLRTINDSKERAEKDRIETQATLAEYSTKKNNVLEILKLFGFTNIEDIELCCERAEQEISGLNNRKLSLELDKQELETEIETIKKHGSSISKELKNALEWLDQNLGYAKTGASYLKELKDENAQKEVLSNAPWITKSMILTPQDFISIANSPTSILPTFIQDSSLIITSLASLQEHKKLSLGDVFIPSRNSEHYVKILDPQASIRQIRGKIDNIAFDIDKIKESLRITNNNLRSLNSFIDNYPPEFENDLHLNIAGFNESIEEYKRQSESILQSIKNLRGGIEEKNREKERIQEQYSSLNKQLPILRELDKTLDELLEADSSLRRCKVDIQHLILKKNQVEITLKELKHERDEKGEQVNRIRKLRDDYENQLEELRGYAFVDISQLQEKEVSDLRAAFDSVNKIIEGTLSEVSALVTRIKDHEKVIDDLWTDIHKLRIIKDELQASGINAPCTAEYLEQLELNIAGQKTLLEDRRTRIDTKKDQHIRLSENLNIRIKAFNQLSEEPFRLDNSLLDDRMFDVDIRSKKDELSISQTFLEQLESLCRLLGNELNNLQENLRSYEYLDSSHHFSSIVVEPAEYLIVGYKMRSSLADSLNKANIAEDRYTRTKDEAIEKIRHIVVFPDFIDTIRSDLKTANDLKEAEFIGQNLDDYLQSINERIQIIQKQVESLKDVEEKIVSQALGIAMRYKDYLKRFPALSKIKLDGCQTEMIRINFKQCEFPEDITQSEMKRYIQQLIEEMDSQQMNDKDLRERFTPASLIGKVLDLNKISVSICKIDTNDTRYQEWEKIQASTGQENAMFIIFLVVLMSYIRNIVVDRKDINTSKVIIIDNPFGTTTACYLWEKIVDILEKNNVQLICPGHKIDSKIREYFPVSHILKDHEMSENGCVRISIRTTAKDEGIRNRIEQESRYGQLKLL
ncbi:hypothetical protein [uncultured Methanomethylovorans sp.]|uniref:hypothetical protein n=1 Tax=uncultured Methanomethylovorans sp. TaxID=183759 RepID=UPI002AA93E2B|nr:hypothetical protein [uncultured Methanomethylovorans sp.]